MSYVNPRMMTTELRDDNKNELLRNYLQCTPIKLAQPSPSCPFNFSDDTGAQPGIYWFCIAPISSKQSLSRQNSRQIDKISETV